MSFRGSSKNFRQTLMHCVLLIAFALSTASASWSVVGVPEDRFIAFENSAYARIDVKSDPKLLKLLSQGRAYVFDLERPSESSLQSGYTDDENAKLIFLRIEDTMCEEVCMTYIFKQELTSKHYFASFLAGRMTTFGDVLYPLCQGCQHAQSIWFSAGDKFQRRVFLVDGEIVF